MTTKELEVLLEPDLLQRIERLNTRYARCLDDDRLEEWPGFFTEDCRYLIHSRENDAQGLEGYVLYLENNSMLRDRIKALRTASLYSIHQDRHFISGATVEACGDDTYSATASFLVVQSDVNGHARIFSVGEYRDHIVSTDDGLKFKERRVIVDSFNFDGMVAVPL